MSADPLLSLTLGICVQDQSLAGTSSFGMSGVNAHALLEAHPVALNCGAQPAGLSWRRQRTWPAPPRSALLASCTPSITPDRAPVAFVADLGSAALSYLHGHQVTCVPGRQAAVRHDEGTIIHSNVQLLGAGAWMQSSACSVRSSAGASQRDHPDRTCCTGDGQGALPWSWAA